MYFDCSHEQVKMFLPNPQILSLLYMPSLCYHFNPDLSFCIVKQFSLKNAFLNGNSAFYFRAYFCLESQASAN